MEEIIGYVIFGILILSVVGIVVYAVYKIIKDSETHTKIVEDKNNIKRPIIIHYH